MKILSFLWKDLENFTKIKLIKKYGDEINEETFSNDIIGGWEFFFWR